MITSKAISEYVVRRRETSVTEALNKVHGADADIELLDPAIAAMQSKSLSYPW
ncbi:MAG: hypothetical protein SGJ17_04555 [Hyphomicrobiales bacterium]|nr:hypothetical protein [Hyphomicrobiales bacterium]